MAPEVSARHVGRIGALAVALGVGGFLVAMPGIAAADVADVQARVDAAKAAADARLSAALGQVNNLSVSVNGQQVIQKGNALASSDVGSRAVARGDNAQAVAVGTRNTATAVGTNAQAVALNGANNRARAVSTVRAEGISAVAAAGDGDNNRAIAILRGDGASLAVARGEGNNARSVVVGDGAAAAGAQGTSNTASADVRGDGRATALTVGRSNNAVGVLIGDGGVSAVSAGDSASTTVVSTDGGFGDVGASTIFSPEEPIASSSASIFIFGGDEVSQGAACSTSAGCVTIEARITPADPLSPFVDYTSSP